MLMAIASRRRIHLLFHLYTMLKLFAFLFIRKPSLQYFIITQLSFFRIQHYSKDLFIKKDNNNNNNNNSVNY